MSSIELQQLMVINKRNQLGWQIKLKSLLLDLAAWTVWGYLVYFIISYFDKIFLSPIVANLYLSEVLIYAFYFVRQEKLNQQAVGFCKRFVKSDRFVYYAPLISCRVPLPRYFH